MSEANDIIAMLESAAGFAKDIAAVEKVDVCLIATEAGIKASVIRRIHGDAFGINKVVPFSEMKQCINASPEFTDSNNPIIQAVDDTVKAVMLKSEQEPYDG